MYFLFAIASNIFRSMSHIQTSRPIHWLSYGIFFANIGRHSLKYGLAPLHDIRTIPRQHTTMAAFDLLSAKQHGEYECACVKHVASVRIHARSEWRQNLLVDLISSAPFMYYCRIPKWNGSGSEIGLDKIDIQAVNIEKCIHKTDVATNERMNDEKTKQKHENNTNHQ